MIEVKNLSKSYGNKVALDNISFKVNQGEILGFLGPNGAGKSTTMNILSGYLSCSDGNAFIGDYDVLEQPIKAKAMVGYLPENPPLYLDMTVKAYLDFMYDLKKVKIEKKSHIKEICELVKISDVYNRIIKNLSKGYKQRVGLAQALLGNPEVLILDEPTVGLDPKQIIEIRTLIKRLGKKHTVILSSHILPEIQAICDRVIVINKGAIVANDTPQNLSNSMSNEQRLIVRVGGPEREVEKLLLSVPNMMFVQPLGAGEKGSFDFKIEGKDGADVRPAMFTRLAEKNWPILKLTSTEMSLEEIFLKLTIEQKGRKHKW